MASTKPINRLTLFKVPNCEDQQKLLAIYKMMPETAKKVRNCIQTAEFPPGNPPKIPTDGFVLGWEAIHPVGYRRPNV
jgi:hypothetical protein